MPPSTHDIDCMWNGSWNERTNTRDVAYVAGLRTLAFTDPTGEELTVVGMNEGDRNLLLRLKGRCIDNRLSGRLGIYRTDAALDCARLAIVHALGANLVRTGVTFEVPSRSLFTATTVRPHTRSLTA